MDDKTLSDLKAKHAGVELHKLRVELNGETLFVIFGVEEGTYKRFRELQTDSGYLAKKSLVMGSVVYPDSSEMANILRRSPGLVDTLANHIGLVVGLGATVTLEKI